jgi:hypothetical protein
MFSIQAQLATFYPSSPPLHSLGYIMVIESDSESPFVSASFSPILFHLNSLRRPTFKTPLPLLPTNFHTTSHTPDFSPTHSLTQQDASQSTEPYPENGKVSPMRHLRVCARGVELLQV